VTILIIYALAALLAPWLSPHDPRAVDLARELLPPGPGAPLGTGENGVDLLSALLHGARVSLYVGVGSVALSLLLGAPLGAVAGYAGGALDEVVMRATDVVLAFPGILLAIFITAVLGPSLENVIVALCATGWTGYARLARAQVRALRERDFVHAARALGASPARIVFRHLLPNAAFPLIVQATFALPAAIIAEASLSFLGLGAPPGTPSWGALVDQGTQYLLIAPHLALFPGLAIALCVLSFNALGDALRDRLDPRAERT
jgi:peptide/nickel transport system permease protein